MAAECNNERCFSSPWKLIVWIAVIGCVLGWVFQWPWWVGADLPRPTDLSNWVSRIWPEVSWVSVLRAEGWKDNRWGRSHLEHLTSVLHWVCMHMDGDEETPSPLILLFLPLETIWKLFFYKCQVLAIFSSPFLFPCWVLLYLKTGVFISSSCCNKNIIHWVAYKS